MGQKWIIDVIADLRSFADQNGLPLLAHQLDVTSTVAQEELAAMSEGGAARGEFRDRPIYPPPFGDTQSGHRT
jgi:predicted transcriptional regulator